MVSAATKERLRKLRQKFGLGEYKNSRTARPKVTKRRKLRGKVNMAKRRGSRKGRSTGGMLSKGILPVSGIVAAALLGAGAATLQDKVLPQYHPLQGVAVGFAVGGIGGAAGAYARNMLSGTGSTKSNSVSGY